MLFWLVLTVSPYVAAETKIVIKGTTEQIGIALSLIQEKVDEDVELRRNMQLCQAKRSPRNKPKSNSPSLAEVSVNTGSKLVSHYTWSRGVSLYQYKY